MQGLMQKLNLSKKNKEKYCQKNEAVIDSKQMLAVKMSL